LVEWLIKLIELKKGSHHPNFPTSALLIFSPSHPPTIQPSALCPLLILLLPSTAVAFILQGLGVGLLLLLHGSGGALKRVFDEC
jgi:hypothetical protein